MDTRSTVIATIKTVAARRELLLAPLDDALLLVDSGLDSLDMALIVAQLEDQLDVDPLSDEENFVFPVTIGEFIAIYERATNQPKA